MGERLPPDNRAKGGSLLVLPTTVTMPKDPLAMTSSIGPTSGAAAWAAGGADCVAPSGAAMATPSPTGLAIVASTTAWVFGGMGYAAPMDAIATASGCAWLIGVGDRPAVSFSV